MADDTPQHLTWRDLRGAVQLASQSTVGVTRIAEGVHCAVWDTLGIAGAATPGRTQGITGLVYRSIYSGAQLAGSTLDVALAGAAWLTEADADAQLPSPARIRALAALNGVAGDYLAATGNPLALSMTLHQLENPLNPHPLSALRRVTGKVALLIHGLCMSDLAWQRADGAGHGAALAERLNYTPIAVRYNSGRHISQSGQTLAHQLEQLVNAWPVPLEELAVIGYSMGGLVIRSALHYAARHVMRWPRALKQIVFLGTPHHGAPLERIGNWVDTILAGTPYTAPFSAFGRMRSAGITDLRYGHLADEDWRGRDRFQRYPDRRRIIPLPAHVACYAVAASVTATRSPIADAWLADRLVGDGLVPLSSALGWHEDSRRDLSASFADQAVYYRTHHLALLDDPSVSARIVDWLR